MLNDKIKKKTKFIFLKKILLQWTILCEEGNNYFPVSISFCYYLWLDNWPVLHCKLIKKTIKGKNDVKSMQMRFKEEKKNQCQIWNQKINKLKKISTRVKLQNLLQESFD